MVHNIKTYNKVLSYLETSIPNIIGLNTFDETNQYDKGSNYITNSNRDAVIVKKSDLIHYSGYYLLNTPDVIFNFDSEVQKVNLDLFQTLEITVETNDDISSNDIKAIFSNVPNAQINNYEFSLDKSKTKVSKGKDSYFSTLIFTLVDDDVYNADSKLDLSSIKSIKITNIDTSILIHDIVVKTPQYTFKTELIDEQMAEAERYILRKIREEEVPDKLKSALVRFTVAHIWLNKWYEEGQKSATLGEFSTESYYDKLMNDINEDIDAYNKDKGTVEDIRYIDTRMLGSRRLSR
jgi:hypothetical protein